MRHKARGGEWTALEHPRCQTGEHYLVIGYDFQQNPVGEMAERLNALVLKTSKV